MAFSLFVAWQAEEDFLNLNPFLEDQDALNSVLVNPLWQGH